MKEKSGMIFNIINNKLFALEARPLRADDPGGQRLGPESLFPLKNHTLEQGCPTFWFKRATFEGKNCLGL